MMSFKVIFLLLAFVLLRTSSTPTTFQCDPSAPCGCSRRPAVMSKVVGGEEAGNQTWGWAVTLSLNLTYLCGGSIISDSWVLTAAHCTVGLGPGEVIVFAATNQVFGLKQIRRASRVITHPAYDKRLLKNDIALIQVSPPFNMSDEGIAKVCLPNATTSDYPPIGSSVNKSISERILKIVRCF